MKKQIRSIAVIFAAAVFFIMACVGWFMDISPATCCSRAIGGAIVAYIVVTIAAKAAIAIVVSEVVQSRANKMARELNK